MAAEPALAVAEDAVTDLEARDVAAAASTTPANSVPMIVTRGLLSPVKNLVMKGLAARKPQSVRFTVVAWTLTNTSFVRGTGAATSTI